MAERHVEVDSAHRLDMPLGGHEEDGLSGIAVIVSSWKSSLLSYTGRWPNCVRAPISSKPTGRCRTHATSKVDTFQRHQLSARRAAEDSARSAERMPRVRPYA